ncbi:MAG: DISARM system helicase DrmA [Pseudomonadota bacterium]
MSERAESQVVVRAALVRALEADLVGPMAHDEVIENRPSRWYLTGFLVPNDTPLAERQDPTVAEGLSIDADDGGEDGDKDEVGAHRAFLPSSMGLSFLVPPGATKLVITASWADYSQLDDATTFAWMQRERERRGLDPLAEDEDPDLRFKFWKRTAEQRTTVPMRLDEAPEPIPLTQDKRVYIEALVRAAPGKHGPPGTRVVSLFLVNGRTHLTQAADQRYLFQTELQVRCKEGFLPRFHQGHPVHPDDRRDDLQYRDHAEWAVGHGVSTRTLEQQGDRCTALGTTWLPRTLVPGTRAREVAGVTLSMTALAALEGPEQLRGGLATLLEAYGTWIAEQADLGRGQADPGRRETAAVLVRDAEQARARMREGIRILCEDPQAFQAFSFMNEAMAATARRQRRGEEPRWRLFQLAFVLLNIAGATQPDHPDRERVELLFFPTGGGKTEAYLGVAAYMVLLRRLRHRAAQHEGAGVAVILRYTLRLLTLDQLQRAAQLVCAMELLRRARPEVLGSHRFSVGIWVGRKATANRLVDLIPVIQKIKGKLPLYGLPRPVPLTACPWCGTPFDEETFELLPLGSKAPHTLQVSCPDDDCPFHDRHDEELPEYRRGIPVLTVDEQIYTELPSIVIGTVDKFASLPWRGASGNLFGRVRAVQDAGFVGANEKPPPEAVPLPGGLLPPELIIQDELHLITGPLGTMVGLYEAAIDALCRDKVAYGPKLIASTATARRATEQIRAVFARDEVQLFPPQGINAGETFFAEVDDRPERSRLYVGVASPGRNMKVLASRVYTCVLGATQKQWEEAGPPGEGNAADTYMTMVSYFNALKELGGAQRIVLEDVHGRTRQLSRRRPLDEEQSEHFADRRISYDILELTSRQSTDDIAEHTALLRKPYAPRGKHKTDVLLASSMISVGVDISRLGLMVVNGQPRTSAEYIQASSRVGRSSPGLVVTAFNLFKPRDRSHYERFASFHESFYRYVEAASVTPFSARAIDRGLAGLVVALTRHLPPRMAMSRGAEKIADVEGLEALIAGILTRRAAAHRADYPPEMLARIASRLTLLLQQWQEIIVGVQGDGQFLKYSPWEKGQAGTNLLSTAVDDLHGNHAELLDHFRAPTSMRDVEPSVHIWVDQPLVEGQR